MTKQRYTPSDRAQRILAGAVRDYTGLGKGCHCSGDWVCGDCAIGQAIDTELEACVEASTAAQDEPIR
jgi:hypothetical protein